ncbi:DUF4188 domain-containing protein [Paenibacillus sp. SYP-B4298]|uniref:DUF4188 domain-containing protein n=1 Tax=Paenibacillus sp. SYP-B4298 TaxID=2996034 RepID=UPI0022DE378F|nr:DUF4188 domain-containing protein [Paenibacillus sp. SYP-B4298]
MGKVMAGRYTAQIKGDFAVFVIGMRVNKLWAIHKWLPVAQAMGPMIKELYEQPESGFMHATVHLSWRGVTVVQYWRSFEALEHYAHHSTLHTGAWKSFNKLSRGNSAVGIYHETYLVAEGQYESIYNNMPVFGLAAATDADHVEIAGGRLRTAAGRLGRR